MPEEDLSYSLQAPVGFLRSRKTVRGIDPLSQLCFGYTLEQLPKRFYTRVAPTQPLPPPQHVAHHPERPNPLRPLPAIIAFCQLFAVCLGGNYNDPAHELLHYFG